MNYIKKALILFLVVSANVSFAQSGSYDKLGMQAMMKGDYKGAVAQLEKADAKTPNNPSVLKMLGYSYFQCGNFESSIETYSRLITVKPSDYSAYYYRGKARQNVANDPKESLNQMRDTFYQSAIKDFTKAIEINGEEDTQLLQNRGLAYKDYAIYKSYKIKKRVDKDACIVLFNNSVSDFQKVLTVQPLRKDIISLIDYVKAQIASLK
ncbi:tetratricopeptide (TPR) repeat protein [Pedobacter cryoconitis]|uniref:Tetratricopeptide (TPR) repeat protein n=1 Tax=Pedobacter cryoconitis TaxID=188932 RepID=A0A7W8ZS60_9SPHI|nr:tetratricopeptide repeat protein [Pedobacter cryoconitis]MBB5639211.1 tetratricopeptide (TPR) repeat protein [Pedobacter cryoconitis]MBB6274816.1 tetratricopeptide (TPR) repeat protein [Pedobacter cryoconitis]